MNLINILDDETINLIAAGEVVERPSSVVKELVENSIDAGADRITVEIKSGGIEFIRITDNGSGIYKDDIPLAFLRHATSKIKNAADILNVLSMGFRGEALSSISQVAKVELTTKRKDDFMAYHYVIEGGAAGDLEEVGAPDGTTIIVRNLFYNTPARRKFLKSETSEANTIYDAMVHLCLSRPDIAFRFISNGKEKLSTSGKNDIKEIIYRIYGKDTSNEIFPIEYNDNGHKITGYLGTPTLNRANRNSETYFVNNRYIKNPDITNGIEEGYRAYMMQHKFPFCVLHIDIDTSALDVNVHPAKLEVRFFEGSELHDFVKNAVASSLDKHEMITSLTFEDEENKKTGLNQVKTPEFFETGRRLEEPETKVNDEEAPIVKGLEPIFSLDFDEDENTSESKAQISEFETDNTESTENTETFFETEEKIDTKTQINAGIKPEINPAIIPEINIEVNSEINTKTADKLDAESVSATITVPKDNIPKTKISNSSKPVQLSFIDEEERVLSAKARKRYKIIGQIFDTYWIIQYAENVYFIDQHAAHEKVNYERIMKRMLNDEKNSQLLCPPIVITLTGREMTVFLENQNYFEQIGFMCEEFGGNEIALRGIPYELYFNEPKALFLSILEELDNHQGKSAPKDILANIATMACKASVKGGDKMSVEEIEALLDELLSLDNPYHCPHGRPTIFSMSKYELEKKFKRIVN